MEIYSPFPPTKLGSDLGHLSTTMLGPNLGLGGVSNGASKGQHGPPRAREGQRGSAKPPFAIGLQACSAQVPACDE